jgi:hypothetical protein
MAKVLIIEDEVGIPHEVVRKRLAGTIESR